jgi:hypothetical protein
MRRRILLLLALAVSTQSLTAQTPLQLSFADAVRLASGQAPPVALATLRSDEADARVRQARAALLPSLSLSAFWLNRTFNSKSLGIEFPNIPTNPPTPAVPVLVGPFDNYDGARLPAGRARAGGRTGATSGFDDRG